MINHKKWIEQLVDSSYIGILVVDSKRNNLFVNSCLCKMFGYEKDILLKSTAEIFHINKASFLEFSKLAFDSVISGTSLELDYKFKRSDGSLFWAHISGDPIKDNSEVLWTLVDVTQRVEAEIEAEYQYNILNSVINATPDSIFYKDYLNFDGKYIGCNDTFSYYVEKDKYDIIGLNDIDLFGKEVGGLYRQEDQNVLKSGKSFEKEEWHTLSNGKKILLSTLKTPFKDINNNFMGVVGVSRDITKMYNKNREMKKLKERMELALLGNNDGIWDWNLLTNEVYYSPRWKGMLGFREDELAGELATWEKLVHKDDKDRVLKVVQANIEGKIDYVDVNHRLRHKNGSWVWIHNRSKAIFDKDGNAVRMIGTHTDITADIEAQNLSYQRGLILDNSLNEIYIFDSENFKFLYINKGAQKNLGYSVEEIRKMTPLDISPYITKNKIIDILQPVIKKEKQYIQAQTIHKRKDGTFYHVDIFLQPTSYEGHNAYVAIALDITERKKMEDELKEQKNILNYKAHHDDLTKLPNRVLLNDRLNQAIENAKRDKSKFALLFIDLDHFKEINDSFGHTVGDQVLQIITLRLQKTVREKDTIARLGGDEFTIILEDLVQSADASLIADKILHAIAGDMNVNGHILYVTASIGISIYPNDGQSGQNLIKYADSAMYKAKEEGRNDFQYYDPIMTELAFERVAMATSLRIGFKEEQFIVYYQPQIDGRTDKLIGMEALVRWQHPTMGLVSPDKFIPLAESTGLIVELDRYVMKTAMTQMAKWYKEGFKPGRLSMNLSVKQLQQADFIEVFKNLMETTGCKAECLALEVTESQIMKNPEEAIKILNQITNLGVELAVDDFGTGYSSLAYLKRLPIHKLKIDRTFVKNLPDNEEDIGITKSVIALAKSLNLSIIAEGVESTEQKDFIVEHGCPHIQGYFYSKPIIADTLREDFLNR
jgi:diguanylate cyclase (GGDEF)-like protein/PAS domain S-box-containing protein